MNIGKTFLKCNIGLPTGRMWPKTEWCFTIILLLYSSQFSIQLEIQNEDLISSLKNLEKVIVVKTGDVMPFLEVFKTELLDIKQDISKIKFDISLILESTQTMGSEFKYMKHNISEVQDKIANVQGNTEFMVSKIKDMNLNYSEVKEELRVIRGKTESIEFELINKNKSYSEVNDVLTLIGRKAKPIITELKYIKQCISECNDDNIRTTVLLTAIDDLFIPFTLKQIPTAQLHILNALSAIPITVTHSIQPTTALSGLDLYTAAKGGDLELVKQAIASGTDVNWRNSDEFGCSALHAAAVANQVDVISVLLTAGADKDIKSDCGQTPITTASARGSIDAVRILLITGADIEITSKNERTPLHGAAKHNKAAVLKLLLSIGADTSAKDYNGWTPLHLAAKGNYVGVAELLLNNGADISAKAFDGGTPLHIAARSYHMEVTELLLNKGADISVQDNAGATPSDEARGTRYDKLANIIDAYPSITAEPHIPAVLQAIPITATPTTQTSTVISGLDLYAAAEIGDLGMVNQAIASGTNVNWKNSDYDWLGYIALHIAAVANHADVISSLLTSCADIDIQSAFGQTPIQAASGHGSTDAVRILLTAGADVEITSKKGRTPLHVAAKTDKVAVAKLLLDNGADIYAKDYQGWTPLHFAAEDNYVGLAELLLNYGADTYAKALGGPTPLHTAAWANRVDVAELLLKNGADKSSKDDFGATPAYVARRRGRDNMANIIDAYPGTPAQPYIPNTWSGIDLFEAAKNGDLTVVNRAIASGTDVNWRYPDVELRTALHAAAQFNHSAVTSALLTTDADKDARNGYGQTPIWVASQSGSTDVVLILLTAGADITIPDRNEGWTPLHAAAHDNHMAVAELLLNNGAYKLAKDLNGRIPADLARQLGHYNLARFIDA